MKRVVKYFSEIIIAIFLIFISYFIWDRIDVEAYEKYITQYTLDDIAVTVDEKFGQLAYINSDESLDSSLLSINNYQNKVYNANVMLELDGVSNETINNLMFVIDDKHYNLCDLFIFADDNKYYFLITKVNLDEYEKRSYNIKLLVNDNYDINDSFSYNIIDEII